MAYLPAIQVYNLKIQCLIKLYSPVVGTGTETVGCIVLLDSTLSRVIKTLVDARIDTLVDSSSLELIERTETDFLSSVFIKV